MRILMGMSMQVSKSSSKRSKGKGGSAPSDSSWRCEGGSNKVWMCKMAGDVGKNQRREDICFSLGPMYILNLRECLSRHFTVEYRIHWPE